MIECRSCRVIFHKLQPQEIGSRSDDGERRFICPFCKGIFLESADEKIEEQAEQTEQVEADYND